VGCEAPCCRHKTVPQFHERVFAPYESKLITVYVEGEVLHPGVYSLPAGSALSDAIRQAGGFTRFTASKVLLVRYGGLGTAERL